MMQSILLFALMAYSLCVFSAEPVDVLAKKDDLDEQRLKSQIEDRLARDIQAYLGNGRFIINVDVSLQKIRQVIKKPRVPNQNIAAQTQDPLYSQIRFPDSTNDGYEENEENLPGLPFIELPADKEKDAELKFMREQIERLQQQQRQPRWSNEGGEDEQSAEDQTVAVFNKIKKMQISLAIEDSISKEQEMFLRSLIYQKASLNDLRGDTLTITRTQFSALPVNASIVPLLSDVNGPAKTWLEENFNELILGLLCLLCAFLLILIALMLRRKPEPVPTASKAAVIEQNHHIPDVLLDDQESVKQALHKIRQEVISLGLGQPHHVQQVMAGLMGQEDKIPMMATVYKVLGRSLFRSIFPNVGQQHLQNIMAFLADTPPDEDKQNQDLQDFHQLLQQKVYNAAPTNDQPFEFLNKLNDSQVLFLIQHEDLRIQALVISQLDPEQAAKVINRIPSQKQAQVLAELGQFETFPLDTFKDVADRLAKQAQQVPSFENVNADGLSMLINMLDSMSQADENKLLMRLKKDKPDTFYKLRQQYYTFADLVKTPRQVLSNALREVDRGFIGRAICNTPDEFKVHVLTALTPKLKAFAREDLKRCEGRIDSKEIEQARREIVQKIREYIHTGKFSMDQLQQIKRAASS